MVEMTFATAETLGSDSAEQESNALTWERP